LPNRNPTFRVFDYDKENRILESYTNYFFNLTEANLPNSKPEWKVMYNSKELFPTAKSLNDLEKIGFYAEQLNVFILKYFIE
jgi:hypothetical protein